MVSVAIDGPAGAGKSTLARRLAAEMGYIYVDTGAMFRTIGLYALRADKDPKDNEAVNALLPEIELHFAFIDGEQHVYLKEEDVSTAIRTEEVGMAASAVGANPAVRAFLLGMQRDMAKKQDVLMDGRDIGTVVLPDATVKIFLTASAEQHRLTAGTNSSIRKSALSGAAEKRANWLSISRHSPITAKEPTWESFRIARRFSRSRQDFTASVTSMNPSK